MTNPTPCFKVKTVKSNRLLVIILFSLVIIAVVILTNLFSFANIEKLLINQLKDKQLTETKAAASQIETHILRVKDELVTLSKFPLMETLNINTCKGDMKIIHEKIEGKIDSLLRADKYGQVIECSSPEFSNYVGLNIRNKDYFKKPEETSEPFIAGMVRQGTNPQIIVSAPLFETSRYTPYPNFQGEFKGVLLSIVELNKLHNLYLHPILETDKNFFLLINLGTGETILKSQNIQEYSEITKYLPKNEPVLNGIVNINGFGRTIITSSELVLGLETWRLIILTPLKNVGKEISNVQRRHFFSLGFVIIVIISVFLFLISIYRSKEEVQFKLDKAKVTLKKFGINAEVEKEKYSQSDINLEPRKVYLIKEDDENHAHELFISSLNLGFAGLGIVREDPNEIKKRYNLEKTSFIWLTKTIVENVPCETNIESLSELIAEFIQKSKKSVILIERMDYILTENRFETVIKKIHALKDLALSHECIVILSVNPDLVEKSQLNAIEAETIDLYGKHLKGKVELTETEMKILQFVNENNVVSRLVSYKDITNEFKITKPTTRAKVSRLQSMGLLQVEQRGRFKSLKITSTGRRIIR